MILNSFLRNPRGSWNEMHLNKEELYKDSFSLPNSFGTDIVDWLNIKPKGHVCFSVSQNLIRLVALI